MPYHIHDVTWTKMKKNIKRRISLSVPALTLSIWTKCLLIRFLILTILMILRILDIRRSLNSLPILVNLVTLLKLLKLNIKSIGNIDVTSIVNQLERYFLAIIYAELIIYSLLCNHPLLRNLDYYTLRRSLEWHRTQIQYSLRCRIACSHLYTILERPT